MKFLALLLAVIGAASAVYVTPFGYSAYSAYGGYGGYGAYPYAASVYSAPVVTAYNTPLVTGYSALPYTGYVAPTWGVDWLRKKKAA